MKAKIDMKSMDLRLSNEKQADEQNSDNSPDNSGLDVEKEKSKNVNDAAAESNRDIHKLKDKLPKSNRSSQ